MYIREKYNRDNWRKVLKLFVKRNAGRYISLEDDRSTIIENIPFKDIVYQPIIKPNKLVLILGNEGNEIFKPIVNPFQIFITQNQKGVDVSLEISYMSDEIIYLHFDD